ncbi:hypothetical protein V8E53_007604 [Lactarius tabidus]
MPGPRLKHPSRTLDMLLVLCPLTNVQASSLPHKRPPRTNAQTRGRGRQNAVPRLDPHFTSVSMLLPPLRLCPQLHYTFIPPPPPAPSTPVPLLSLAISRRLLRIPRSISRKS